MINPMFLFGKRKENCTSVDALEGRKFIFMVWGQNAYTHVASINK